MDNPDTDNIDHKAQNKTQKKNQPKHTENLKDE